MRYPRTLALATVAGLLTVAALAAHVCPNRSGWTPLTRKCEYGVRVSSAIHGLAAVECMAGVGVPYADDGCDCSGYDLDGDGDVDLHDVALLTNQLGDLIAHVRQLP